jgi:16S rRNA (guanine(966)-N(2))-methyltransferase RsmD
MTRPARRAEPPGASGQAARRAGGAGEVRLIGGQWRGRKLAVADRPGLRPTPDRVRQTLFDWLMHRAGGSLAGWQCADVFAGTGVLGFEAASREAASVVLLENDPVACTALSVAKARLQAHAVEARRADGLAWLRACPAGTLDLVFLDPPFGAPFTAEALHAAARAVRSGGWIYLEAGERFDPALGQADGLILDRHLQAGAVHAHLWHLAPPAPGTPAA